MYLGLPLTGRRLPDGGFDELIRLGSADAVLNLFGPILSQAIDEAPAALAAVRADLGIPERPIGVAGGSLGGMVAASVIAEQALPVMAAALVNPAVRVAGAVAANERRYDMRYEWTDPTRAIADRFDFQWHSVPGMPHHLAEPPGIEPAPQNGHAAAVDAIITSWFADTFYSRSC